MTGIALASALLAVSCAQALGIKEVPPADAGVAIDGPSPAESGVDAAGADAPLGLASFDLLVDGVVHPPIVCAPEPLSYVIMSNYKNIAFRNSGSVAVALIIRPNWNLGVHYIPGATSGSGDEQAGVLAPGDRVDFTAEWGTASKGIVAILGSAEPFTKPAAGTTFDEGVIAWPNGVAGSGGATQMHVVELTFNYGRHRSSGRGGSTDCKMLELLRP